MPRSEDACKNIIIMWCELQNTQCPDCIGDERLPLEETKFPYCRPNVRNDHWDDTHLKERELAEQQGRPQVCKHPKCVLEYVRLEVSIILGTTWR